MADSKIGVDIAAPSELQPAQTDWAGLRAKAMEQPEISQELGGEEPVKIDTLTQEEILDLPETAKVKVKLDGVEEIVTYKDFKDALQREAHYTRRMQTLAQQRKEAEEAIVSKFTELQLAAQAIALAREELKQNANPIDALAAALKQEKKQTVDPNEIATIGDIEKILSAERERLNKEFETRELSLKEQMAHALSAVDASRHVERDAERYNSGLNSIMASEDGQLVNTLVPYADQIIRYKVVQMDPKTIEEGIEFTQAVVKELADAYRAKSMELTQKSSHSKAKAKLESPIGAAPPIKQAEKPAVFTKDGKLDWNALRARANAMMD